MELTTKMKQVFEPLLTQFCKNTKPIEIDEEFSSIFIPHIMSEYSVADRKIFYFGRDTNGWIPTSELIKAYDSNNLSDYIQKTSKWANEFEFLEYNNNQSSSFWTLVIRLHLRLKGITENLTISDNLPKEYYNYIKDFGWGNTNAIEVPQSLQNQGVWENLDKEKYREVKEHSKIFDRLIHTIDAYKPNIVFVFHWDCDEKKFLEGLNYQEQKLDLINNRFWTYFLPETNTRIIWTAHPSGAKFFRYSVDEMIDEIIEYMKNEDIFVP